MTEEYNPHKLSAVECGCGCENLMPQGIVNKGWRYLRGHKPTTSIPVRASGVRKYVKSNMGPEQIAAYFAAQIEQLRSNSKKLKDEAQELLAQAKNKMTLAKEIDEQVVQIDTVRAQTQDALSRIFKQHGGTK